MAASPQTFSEIKEAWVADLESVALRNRWGPALGAIGGVHLAFFLSCQMMHHYGDRVGWHYVVLWALELATVLSVFTAITGRKWLKSSPLVGLIARIWGTVLILSFSLASMNSLSGLDHEWFKPVLCTLASFGFMMMAYLISTWFFAGAVWMSLTGVFMLNALDYSYLIHGISWSLVLATIASALEFRRRKAEARDRRPAEIRATIPTRPSSPHLRVNRRG